MITICFNFEVGDFVQAAWDAQTQPKSERPHGLWQVIERCYSEHCGGYKVQYVCRSLEAFANKRQTVAFNACEIVKFKVSE